MKVLIAPDKFKGSLSAYDVCLALEEGLKKRQSNITVNTCPLADGGDGSLAVLEHYLDLKTMTKTVQGPLGRPIQAAYKMAKTTAYIELSAASGLVLLKPSERNCMDTSTFGTGQLIADALENGATKICLFIGGSATNDGAMGIARALGYRFYDTFGKLLKPIGKNLLLIDKIDDSQLIFDPQEVLVQVICDVTNPLFGENGAAYVYAAQKGANPSEIIHLDRGLANLAARLVAHDFPSIVDIPGAGAAGGVGGGCMAFLDAQLVSGITTFIKLTQLEQHIAACDLVITGEGKLDAQTEQGKVVSGVAALAKKHGKPLVVVCGTAEEGVAQQLGISEIYTILNRSISVEEAMEKAAEKLMEIGEGILNKKQ